MNLQSPERVLFRAYALSAVVMRSHLEAVAGDKAQHLKRLRGWIDERDGLVKELEPHERSLIWAAPRSLAKDQMLEGTWRAEGLAVLGWALGVSDLPDHQSLINPVKVANAVGFLHPTIPPAVGPPKIRPESELIPAQHRLFALHWRLREFAGTPKPIDFQHCFKTSGFDPLAIDGVPLCENDLCVAGVPIARADIALVQQAHSIAMERHQAINWLLGTENTYSDVDTST